MAALKPVQPSVASFLMWKKMWETAQKKPSQEQLQKAVKDTELFSRVYKRG